MTHLAAKALYEAGNITEAWKVAQQDEGLLDDVTFEKWDAWMASLIAA